jgi:DNA-binding NarL/FixJ family response regulator
VNTHQTEAVREEEVLRLLALCYSHRKIAEQLQTDVETVVAQKAEAMKKLGLHSRIDIIRYVEQQGWLGEVGKVPDQMQQVGI